MSHCKHCSKEFKPSSNKLNLYCSNSCQLRYQHEEFILRWLNGLEVGWVGKTRQISKHIVRYLRCTRGTACEFCGWDEKHPIDGAILTEIDHIDGNAENCHPENLRILCPNCHSMTPTFRNRNKDSKRNRSPCS